MSAKWIKFNRPGQSGEAEVVHQNQVDLPSLSPGEKGRFDVNRPANWKSADALHLTATNKYGQEIFTWSYPVKMPDRLSSEIIDYSKKGRFKVANNDDNIHVEANGISYSFSKETGMVLEVKKGDRIIPFSNGPVILGHQDKIDTLYVRSSETQVEITTIFEKTNKSPAWASLKEYSLTPDKHVEGGDPKGRVSPHFPEGDISFLKNIPSIGTKFQESNTMGPQGNPEIYFGNDDVSIEIKLTFEF